MLAHRKSTLVSGAGNRPKTDYVTTLFVAMACGAVLIMSGCAGVVSQGSATQTQPTTLTISLSSLPNGQVSSAWSATLTATGGTAPYSWQAAPGSSLPAWMTLNASTGQMSGIPTQAGTITISIQVNDSSATPHTANKTFTVTISAASSTVSVTTASLANGQVGAAYSATVAATGGTTPYSWSISSGSLPTSLSLNSSSGQITGTPGAAGSFTFTLQVKDSSSTPQTANKSFTVNISAASSTVSITTSSLANGQVGTAYSATVAASGGATPYSWSISSGPLPTGLSLNSSGGQITGTPGAAGSFTFTVQVKDSSATPQTASKSFTITIVALGPTPLSIVTTALPNGQASVRYSASPTATGGTPPYSWSVSSGSLPPGLTLNTTTALISGTPSQAGSYPFTIQVKDSTATPQTASQPFTVTIGTATAGTPVTACGTLSNAGTTYTLQNDVSSSGTCMLIGADNVTFDLNGHTITYDTGGSSSVYGVTDTDPNTILGTHITSSNGQGNIQMSNAACYVNLTTGPGQGLCATSHAVWIRDGEVDHLTLTYYGEDSHGIYLYYGSTANVHDNILYPNHTKAALTHYVEQGEIEIFYISGLITVQNNTIGAVGGGYGLGSAAGIFVSHPNTTSRMAEIYNNNLKMAAAVHDGYAILIGCGNSPSSFEVSGNTINEAGRGILIDNYSTNNATGCTGVYGGTVHDNNVTVNESPDPEGAADAVGIQARGGANNVDVYHNTVTLNVGSGACPPHFYTDTGSDCEGLAIKLLVIASQGGANLVAHDNTVVANTNTTTITLGATGLYGDGIADSGSSFYNNSVTGNSILTSVNGVDGCGDNWLFRNNTLSSSTPLQTFMTLGNLAYCNTGSSTAHDTNNIVLQDNTYAGSAGQDDIGESYAGSGNPFSYYVKWSYNVTVLNGATPVSGVTVTAVATGGGTETVSGTTNSSGQATLVLTNHYVTGTTAPGTQTNFTPHNVTYSGNGCSGSTTVNITATTSVTLPCT